MARRCSVERANKQIGGFASAKKNMVIQYEGRERSTKHLLELIHDDVLTKGVAEEEIEQLDIYVKPEEQAVYYVVNQKIERPDCILKGCGTRMSERKKIMATVYVIANQKGGIGKTTTATTLAGILNQKGKTLLIDADPQGNSTSTYQAAIEDTATLYDVMVDEDPVPLDEAVQHMENGDIVASDPLLAKAGKLLDGNVEGMYRLLDALEMLDGYDYIVIDTAPSLDIVLYNCLIAADEVIIPVTADAFALQGLTKLSDTIHAVQKRQNRNLQIAGLLLVKYAGRSNLEKDVRQEIEEVATQLGTKLFPTAIRECVKTKEAQLKKRLLSDYAPNCTTMQDYNQFVEELLGK